MSVSELVDAALEAVGRSWPGVVVSPFRVLGQGFSSVVVETGSGFVVKVARTGEAAAGYRREAQVLPVLHGRLPVLVPELIGEVAASAAVPFGAVVQRRVAGAPMGVDVRGPHLAPQVASVVAALHRLPPEMLAGWAAGVVEWRDDLVGIAELALPAARGALCAAEAGLLEEWWQMFGSHLRGLDPADGVPVHGDLWHENMLTSDGHLTAVLDWETCALGDPAVDLAGLWYLGEGFGSQILGHYQSLMGRRDAQLPDRVGWFRVARELNGVAWSVRHGDKAELAESIAKLRGVLHAPAAWSVVDSGR